jgi:glycosyltransferase involved in cell wall biosynthesis
MLKVAIITNFGRALVQMRGPLLRELLAHGHEVIVCAPGEDAAAKAELAAMGVGFWAADVDRTGTNPLRDLAYLGRLIRFLRAVRPHKVIAISSKPVIYAGLAARFVSGADLFAMISGLGYVFSGRSLHQRLLAIPTRLLYRASFARYERVFFQNRDDQRLFVELGMLKASRQAMVVEGDGVDLQAFAPVSCPGNSSFLLIARLLIDKGIREFVEAARLVKRERPRARFVLVGWFDANPAAISREEVEGWVAEGVIEFPGFASDVRPHIAGCDVYVLPSYREGMPRTIVEAMSMARPVITTDAPGCRDAVTDGVNGYVVPTRDAPALAAAMLRILESPQELRRMGERSREIAERRFGFERINSQLLNAMFADGSPVVEAVRHATTE